MDAFSLPWSDFLYLFPPVPLISKVLIKFAYDNVKHGLIICPYWPSQPWFPLLLDLLIDFPLILPAGSVQDHDSILPRHCQFLALSIGTLPALKQEFLEKLPNVPLKVFQKRPLMGTNVIGAGSPIGVVQGKLVTGICL